MDIRTISITPNLMPREAWLNYNGFRSIKIDRLKMAKTCSYFNCLLEGPFKESKQRVIEIILGNMFSFEAFDCVVSYANDNIFTPDENKVGLYVEAIQLAMLWGYEEFIELIENYFIDILSPDWLVEFTVLVNKTTVYLQRLNLALEEFEVNLMLIDMRRAWPSCAIDGHQYHCYINCVDKPGAPFSDDWDEQVFREPKKMTELAKLEIDKNRQRGEDKTRKHIKFLTQV